MKYVCLLRGINVGGKNKIDMPGLKSVFEAAGFGAVQTYINSGNIIFESSQVPKNKEIEAAIFSRYKLEVPVLVIDAETVQQIAEAIPVGWQNDDHQKSDVAYLFKEVDDANIVMKIAHNPDIETAVYEKGALLFNIDRRHVARSSLKRIVGTPLYQKMTIRNINTARKLAELVS